MVIRPKSGLTSSCLRSRGFPGSTKRASRNRHCLQRDCFARKKPAYDSRDGWPDVRSSNCGRPRGARWEGDPNSLGSPTILPNPKTIGSETGFHQFKFHKLQLRPLILSDGLTDADPDRWPFDPADAFEYEWSVPENLGPEINTQHFEEHPELTGNGLECGIPEEESCGSVQGCDQCSLEIQSQRQHSIE